MPLDWSAVFASVIGAVGTAISGYLVWWLKQQHLIGRVSDHALCGLLKAQIRSYHRESTERGSVTYDELEDVLELHKAYKALGGNGAVDRMIEDISTMRKTVR